MTDDVTIPRVTAKRAASALRRQASVAVDPSAAVTLDEVADLLDPPAASLRDGVADLITERAGTGPAHDPLNRGKADLVLAVVRKRAEALDQHWCVHVGGALVRRADLLALLGGEPDE